MTLSLSLSLTKNKAPVRENQNPSLKIFILMNREEMSLLQQKKFRHFQSSTKISASNLTIYDISQERLLDN